MDNAQAKRSCKKNADVVSALADTPELERAWSSSAHQTIRDNASLWIIKAGRAWPQTRASRTRLADESRSLGNEARFLFSRSERKRQNHCAAIERDRTADTPRPINRLSAPDRLTAQGTRSALAGSAKGPDLLRVIERRDRARIARASIRSSAPAREY